MTIAAYFTDGKEQILGEGWQGLCPNQETN